MSGWSAKLPRTRRQKFCEVTDYTEDESVTDLTVRGTSGPSVEFRHVRKVSSSNKSPDCASEARAEPGQQLQPDHSKSDRHGPEESHTGKPVNGFKLLSSDKHGGNNKGANIPYNKSDKYNFETNLKVGSDSGKGNSSVLSPSERLRNDHEEIDTVDMAVQRVTDTPPIVRRKGDDPPSPLLERTDEPRELDPDDEQMEDEFFITNFGAEKPAIVIPKKGHSDIEADQVDHDPERCKFTWRDIVIYCFAIVSYLFDVGTDAWVATLYFRQGDTWWFILTLLFIIVPSVTMTIFSLKWYLHDHQNTAAPISRFRWVSRFMFLFLQIAPLLRYIDTLIFGCRSRSTTEQHRKRKWYEKMIFEDVDATLLRLIECFMEAAPQLCLQLYIMMQGHTEKQMIMLIAQIAACSASLISLSWSQVAYHRALRVSLNSKANMSIIGSVLQFLWRAFTIAARILALALFASMFKYWLFVLIGVHALFMLIWIRFKKSHFCTTQCEEFCFNAVIAVVYIFSYLNLIEGHTRLRYLFYYIIVYAENAAMLVAWCIPNMTKDIWYTIPAIAVVLGGFIVGILFQVIYYLKFHPNNYLPEKSKHIKVCLSWKELMRKPEKKQKDIYYLKELPVAHQPEVNV